MPAARHAVADHLRRSATADPPLSDIGLMISEAVTNAVTHAYLGGDPGQIRVTVAFTDDDVLITIEDDGRGMLPRPDSPGMGLGLPLMATVADRLEADTGPYGGARLCAWFSRHPEDATLDG